MAGLHEYRALHSVHTEGNPLQSPPQAVVDQGMRALVDYFKQLRRVEEALQRRMRRAYLAACDTAIVWRFRRLCRFCERGT